MSSVVDDNGEKWTANLNWTGLFSLLGTVVVFLHLICTFDQPNNQLEERPLFFTTVPTLLVRSEVFPR